jgi:hypothetical protein
MNKLPLARSKDIIVQKLGKEVLIYNLKTNKAYCLNETSAIVYHACDGKTTFDEIKANSNFTDEIIYLALDELKKENLFEKDAEFNVPLNNLSRREIIKKIGTASLVALPTIVALVTPVAAQSGSCLANGKPCSSTASNPSGGCCSTHCEGTCY